MEDINSGYPERMHWEGFMITTKTGEKRFLEARNIPLPDQNLMISIAWDITERKQAEEAKRASEELFKHVFEDANVGKSIITPGGEIKVNKAFCNLLGYQYEELQNKNQKDITHPDDIELTQNEMNKLINDEAQQVRFNKRYLHKNGSIIWADVSSSSMRDKTGELKNLITTIIDITERKKAEKALQASKDFLDKIINSVASPIFVKDDLHRFCLVNDALYSLLNLPVEKLIGTTGYEYFPEEQMKIFIAKDQKVFLSGIENINEEQLTDGTGKVRYIITRKTLYTDTAGKKFLVGVISDITERKHAEEALNELNLSLEHIIAERTEQLEITNKELESFAYSVSHDLRAPLRGIDGFSKILLEDYSDVLDHEGHRLLNVIITNIQKMSQLIEDLLNFSRISRQDIKRYKIDMKNLFSSCYFELTTDEQRDKIIFDLDVVPESFGDPALIKQLITNLLSNAIKFSSKTANPSIIIGYNVDNKKVIFFIRDNGVGFDMKYYDKLFGVFQRLHSNVEYEGTGVGLAIAQRIINRHGGNIWAESVLNEGATFYFSL